MNLTFRHFAEALVGSLPGQGEVAGLRVVDLEDAVIDVVDLRIADAP
jgi:hypothetical protein